MSIEWSSVIADERCWTEHVCRYLDDWSPELPEMLAHRAVAFEAVRERLLAYVRAHGETLRTTFRHALLLDIHRRFVHLHGHDIDDDPLDLYEMCAHDPTLKSEKWAGEPLAAILDHRMAEFVTDSSRSDPDPDVITGKGTSDLPAIVALAEQRRVVGQGRGSDLDPIKARLGGVRRLLEELSKIAA